MKEERTKETRSLAMKAHVLLYPEERWLGAKRTRTQEQSECLDHLKVATAHLREIINLGVKKPKNWTPAR